MIVSRTGTLALAMLLAGCGQQAAPEPSTAGGAPLPRMLGADASSAAFAHATAPARLQFPRDHGPHPGHRIEWWYLTSNLEAADGRRFGTEFALFRIALRPGEVAIQPDWDSGQLFLVHAAVSELSDGRFHYLEQVARPALGQAGARALPFRTWVGDCEAAALSAPGEALQAVPPQANGAGSDTLLPLRVRCGDARFGYDLVFTAERGKVLHGQDGYSEKSGAPGSASYYYSYPMLAAEGELRLGAEDIAVRGAGWFDHEWGSAVLAPGQRGWDWFSLRLSDGSALMLFRIRDLDQQAVAVRGTFVHPDGRVQTFTEGVVEARPTRHWTSPASGVGWPIGWTLRAPTLSLELTVDTPLPAQELATTVHYWEGAISASGSRAGSAVTGEGYLELTGYGPADRAGAAPD